MRLRPTQGALQGANLRSDLLARELIAALNGGKPPPPWHANRLGWALEASP
jgi:hypothetical protein